MMRRNAWEIFDPRNGEPVRVTRWEWVARRATRCGWLDYARRGDGWPS